MAHHKTISLCDDTRRIADKLPNFSRFVRQCLRKHAAHGEPGKVEAAVTGHIAPQEAQIWGETKDKCNPMHKNGRCVKCWGEL